MLRPFEVALFFNAVPFATRSFDSSRPFEVALFFNSLRPFEVALLFNAVPFKDSDTAARSFKRPFKDTGSIRSFLRPLDADALRSFQFSRRRAVLFRDHAPRGQRSGLL